MSMTLDTVWAVVLPRNGLPGVVYGSTHRSAGDAWTMAVAMLYGPTCDFDKCRRIMFKQGYRARRVRIVLDDDDYYGGGKTWQDTVITAAIRSRRS